ncbi:MAG: hypothetical protein ACSLE0_23245 [Chitinophagaceae bacterium]
MILPETIKVGNIVYTIKREHNEGYFGFHDFGEDKNEIVLDPYITGQKLRNVFFHELTHAILYQIGAEEENENELFVQSLANELDKLFEIRGS